MGYLWLEAGISKFQDGWLERVALTAQRAVDAVGSTSATVSEVANGVANVVSSASAAVDTAASASIVGEGGATLMNLIGQHTPKLVRLDHREFHCSQCDGLSMAGGCDGNWARHCLYYGNLYLLGLRCEHWNEHQLPVEYRSVGLLVYCGQLCHDGWCWASLGC